ncbi:MAG: hypothetical protein JSS68_15000 [Actinobacteria bacterium]|nr:hypothetical protein [Actinomycetota bacterium]
MRGWPITYEDFSGGLNTTAAPYLLQGNQCRDALNVHTSLIGDIEKRNGYVTVSGTSLTGSPVNATAVHTLFPSNTATKALIGVATTVSTDTIFKMTPAGVCTTLKTGQTAGKRWYFAQAEVDGSQGPIFGLNGVDTPLRWNGESASMETWTATTGTVPKEAKYLTYFSGRLWCAEGSRLRFSGITGSTPDPLNWDPEEYVDMEPNDGQVITGIGIVGSLLLVFKARKTYVVYNIETGANRPVSGAIGCVSHRSIVQTDVGTIFLSEDQGVCVTDGKTIKILSEVIKPQTDAIAASPLTAVNAAGVYSGRRYYLSVSLNGARNDHTLEFDAMTSSWWIHSCATNQFALLDPGGNPVLYSADAKATRVSEAFVPEIFQDNGVNYEGNSYYVSPELAPGFSGSVRYLRYVDPHKTKRIREIRMDGVGAWESFISCDREPWEVMDGETWASSGESEVGYFGVAETPETEFGGNGPGVFGEASEVISERRYHTPGLGRTYSLKVEDTTPNNFKIYSQTIAIQLRED